MTYPVGTLPNTAQITEFSLRNAPVKSVAFTHGGSDLDLTDPSNGLNPCASEFYPTTTGNLVARLTGDAVDRTYPVTAGQVVRGLFTLIRSTSTSDGVARH